MLDELIKNVDLDYCLVDLDETVQGMYVLDRIKDEANLDEGLEHIIYVLCEIQPI